MIELLAVHLGTPAAARHALPRQYSPEPIDDLPCHSGDPDLWFAERPDDISRAKQLCADCPIRSACLAGALERAEPWGVWGGQLIDNGVVIARKRGRGRPRKNEAAVA